MVPSFCLRLRMSQRVCVSGHVLPAVTPTRFGQALRFSGTSSAPRMHVLARGKMDRVHSKVFVPVDADVDDLKQAVIAMLMLDVPPTRVRLVLEQEGGTTRDLDDYAQLAQSGVTAGSRVLMEVEPRPASTDWPYNPPSSCAHTRPAPLALPFVLIKHPRFSTPTRVSFLPGATAKDLAKAAVAELGLSKPFGDLQVCLEQGKPLSELEPLEAQGVTAGSVVHLEQVVTCEWQVLACLPPTPRAYPPLSWLTHTYTHTHTPTHTHPHTHTLPSAAHEVEAAQR